MKIFPFRINNFGHFFLFTIGIIESILPFSEAAVIAEAKAEEETEKACVASKHDPVTIMEISSLMTLVSLRSFEYYAISLQFMQ